MRTKELQGIGFVQAHHVGSRQRPTSIYLRSSFTTGDKGAANGIAQAWHNPNNRVSSCHYVVDEAQMLQCLPVNRASYPIDETPYKNAISINVCHNPPEPPSMKVTQQTARLVGLLSQFHEIKLRLLDDEQLTKWSTHRWRSRGGLITTDYWGVCNEAFLDLVRTEYVKYLVG